MSRSQRVRAELSSPWTGLAAAFSGGMAWAVAGAALTGPAGLAVGAGVGVLVLGTQLGLAALRGEEAPGESVHVASVAGAPWMQRGRAACAQLRASTTTAAPGAATGDEAASILEAMTRVDTQLAAVERGLHQVRDVRGELTSLQARLSASGDNQPQLATAVRSLQDQVAVRTRLLGLHEQLVAQLTSSAIGLEGLHARLVELSVQGVGQVDLSPATLASLTDEMEGLRQGLVEAEAESRAVLAG